MKPENAIFLFLPLIFLLLLPLSPFAEAAKYETGEFRQFTYGERQKMRVGFAGGRIRVQLRPRKGDGLYRFASWTMRDWKNDFKKIAQYKGGRPLRVGRYVTFPFRVLNSRIQGIALQALFSNDSREEAGWMHRVTYRGETVSLIAGIFAKTGIGPSRLIAYNGLPNQGRSLKIGDEIVIPWKWIKTELNLRKFDVKPPLFVKKGKIEEPYAYYRLQKGESVYSAVIVRFTERTLADDVNELARSLMRLNRIKNARLIRAGAVLKIPIEWIGEEYRIQSIVHSESEVGKSPPKTPKTTQPKSAKKPGRVHIILDAGHGGRDPGATFSISGRKKVFEDETVYDICLRLTEILEKEDFHVHPTLNDPDQKKPKVRLATEKDEDETLLVHPPYRIRSAKVGVNMRIFLINSIYRKLRVRDGIPPSDIALISVHGDALHKSLRGATVYFPDHRLRVSEFRLGHKIYRRRKEYQRRIEFPAWSNRMSAKLSRNFGNTIIETFKREGLEVHRSFAVRGYHYRRGVRTLPGVLRYSKIPISILLEVGNLNNPQDRKKLLQADYRKKIALTLARSIKRHFRNNRRI